MNNTATCANNEAKDTRSVRNHKPRAAATKYGRNEVKLVGILGVASYQHSHMDVDYYDVRMELVKPDGNDNHVPVQLDRAQLVELYTAAGVDLETCEIFNNVEGQTFDLDFLVEVVGTLRSVKRGAGTHIKKVVFVKIRKATLLAAGEDGWDYVNEVFLEGEVVKTFNSRMTEKGREVQDLLLNVRRHPERDCYIYIVTIGDMAKVAKELQIGNQISLKGAFVNRVWTHKTSGEEMESNEVFAFEVNTL